MYARGQMKLELEKNVMESGRLRITAIGLLTAFSAICHFLTSNSGLYVLKGAVDKEVALGVDEDLDVEAVKELLESSLIRK